MFHFFKQNCLLSAVIFLIGMLVPALGLENDEYANSFDLGEGSVQWTRSNVGADVEPGEPAGPSGVRTGTLWYIWKATVAGWWKIDTSGSSFNTVLAMGAGPSMSEYEEFAVDDDTATGRAAKLVFYANLGQAIRISLGGADGAEGAVHLAITPATEPAPRMTGAQLNTGGSELDAGADNLNLTLLMDVLSPNGFGIGQLRLCKENGGLVFSKIFNHHQRTGGTYLAGQYEVSLELSPLLPPGKYFLEYRLQDWDQNETITGLSRWSTAAPESGVLACITMTNSGDIIDSTPPVLLQSNEPEPVDFAYGAGQAVFLLDVEDTQSGVHGGQIRLYPASGGPPLEFEFSERELVSGNETTARFLVSCEVAAMPATVCHSRIILFDRTGNVTVANGADVICANSLGSYADWSVINRLSGAAALPDSDSDADGVINTLEYAFGMSPDCPDNVAAHLENSRFPHVRFTGTSEVIIDYTRRVSALDVQYFVEGATGLIFDQTIPEIETLWTDGKFERVRCKATLPVNTPTYFARVRVEVD